jgi:DNA-binding transcriptional LysR family regulator
VGLVQAGAGLGILPRALATAERQLRPLDLPGAIPPQAIFVAYSRGMLDAVLPATLAALRAVVKAQNFCG